MIMLVLLNARKRVKIKKQVITSSIQDVESPLDFLDD